MKKINLQILDTEQVNPNTTNIDTLSTTEMLKSINNEDKKIAAIVEEQIPIIGKLVDSVNELFKQGGRLIYVGAGTSGRLGVLDASECPPTYGVSAELIQGMIAGGYSALLKAKEGAEDSLELPVEDLKNIQLNDKDTVVGLAASGRTPYVIGALKYAASVGANTGAISCVHNAEISAYANHAIEVVTGPEVVTGSTRMKAGTAQKLVLNMISTSLMIHYGKVYRNLMIDVQPSNDKLKVRALNIIQQASGCSEEEAKLYLEASENNVKIAIIMAIAKLDQKNSIALLENAGGNVSRALHNLKKQL